MSDLFDGLGFMGWLTKGLPPDEKAEIERKVDGLIVHVGAKAATCRAETTEPHWVGEFPETCRHCRLSVSLDT